jgi:hypothetical protein
MRLTLILWQKLAIFNEQFLSMSIDSTEELEFRTFYLLLQFTSSGLSILPNAGDEKNVPVRGQPSSARPVTGDFHRIQDYPRYSKRLWIVQY